MHTKDQFDEIVVYVRLELYNRGLPCGPRAIRNRILDWGVSQAPSERTIARRLHQNGLTHGRTGIYPGEEVER